MNTISLIRNFFKLRANAKRTRAELLALQNSKLRALLAYAWENSAWHRERFESCGFTKAQLARLPLSSLPTMDKRDLLEHFDAIVTTGGVSQEKLRQFDENSSLDRRAFLDNCHIVHSSGSTGKPGYFLYDGKAWDEMLSGIVRGALWGMSNTAVLKLLAGGLRILYLAATDGRYGGAMAVGDGADGLCAKQLHLDIKTPLPKWLSSIREFKPNFIIGYPSAIKILGELVHNGEIGVTIHRVVSCGEPLTPNMREFLENTFHTDVVNFYGASESLALGVEMGGQEMTLFDDMNIIEVQDGVMYLTNLYNFAQPLIRYRLNDSLTLREPSGGTCPFTRAGLLLGRDEDILWFEDGKGGRDFLHPLAVEGFCIQGLRDYQFWQTGPASFEMLAEASSPEAKKRISSELPRLMKGILQEKQLGYVSFELRFVPQIPPDPYTGKKKLILPAKDFNALARA